MPEKPQSLFFYLVIFFMLSSKFIFSMNDQVEPHGKYLGALNKNEFLSIIKYISIKDICNIKIIDKFHYKTINQFNEEIIGIVGIDINNEIKMHQNLLRKAVCKKREKKCLTIVTANYCCEYCFCRCTADVCCNLKDCLVNAFYGCCECVRDCCCNLRDCVGNMCCYYSF